MKTNNRMKTIKRKIKIKYKKLKQTKKINYIHIKGKFNLIIWEQLRLNMRP